MSNVVIKVENLGKQYRLGKVGTGTVSQDLNRWWHSVRGKEDPYLKIGEVNNRTQKASSNDVIWAIKDVNFEVKSGEVLGIIGKNGAGKSTLLKILSRVTGPSVGNIKVKGRIASLLEVGTGFHPELTGRENIFLNGAILGMTKREIKSKLDEIVAFSGVERYLDTPVKRYSSGMYVRLAFAVAAHLEPEILIVDEVLAVGDADFQRKCLGKMKDVSGEGRTVLFVSHNMAAIKSLCSKGIILESGELKLDSDATSVIDYYMNGSLVEKKLQKGFNVDYENETFKLKEISIKNIHTDRTDLLVEDLPIELKTNLVFHSGDAERYHVTYHLNNEMGEPLFSFSNAGTTAAIKPGENELICVFPRNFFQSGTFYLSLYIVIDNKKSVFSEKDIFSFSVVDGEREIGTYMGREPGYIKPKFEWNNK